jgi:hypothetical protein
MRKYLLLGFFALVFLNINAQETKPDKRALNYYSQEQIANMPDVKIKQINYLYQKSFVIPKEFEAIINADEINIRDYSNLRLSDKRAKVFIKNTNAHSERESENSYYINLISIDELQQAYKEIK